MKIFLTFLSINLFIFLSDLDVLFVYSSISKDGGKIFELVGTFSLTGNLTVDH